MQKLKGLAPFEQIMVFYDNLQNLDDSSLDDPVGLNVIVLNYE